MWPCPNCATAIFANRAQVFCSRLCTQTAKAVRYWRGAISDGREIYDDVHQAIQYKVGFVLGGGLTDFSLDERHRHERVAERGDVGPTARRCYPSVVPT